MIGLVTTLSTVGGADVQPVDSEVQLKASTEYLINTENIVLLKVANTTDSDVYYKLNRKEDRTPYLRLRVNETNAAVSALADVAAASNMVSLDVFTNEEGENCISFTECGLSGSSTVAKYYNLSDIVWAEENNSATISLVLISEGGHDLQKIFVDSNLGQIMDLITTGTTTTTTSSTSTTSTSA